MQLLIYAINSLLESINDCPYLTFVLQFVLFCFSAGALNSAKYKKELLR